VVVLTVVGVLKRILRCCRTSSCWVHSVMVYNFLLHFVLVLPTFAGSTKLSRSSCGAATDAPYTTTAAREVARHVI